MTTTRVPARDLILAALAQATTLLTVTELAEQAGVGRSTVSKYLPLLEKEGAALRTPGGREGRRRLPDQWQATSMGQDTQKEGTTSESVEPAQEPAPTKVEEETSPLPQTAETATSTTPEPKTQQADTPSATPAPRTRPNVENTTPLGASPGELNAISGTTRLAPGELKTMVWALLKADPQTEFTATALSHLLQGRSIGAIQNNLAKLAKEGKAELTCNRPRRYRFATSAH